MLSADSGIAASCILPCLLQELDLPIEQLSLLDDSCRATKNRTHVILRTALDRCQTRKITVDDNDVYSNAVRLRLTMMSTLTLLDSEAVWIGFEG